MGADSDAATWVLWEMAVPELGLQGCGSGPEYTKSKGQLAFLCPLLPSVVSIGQL